MIDQNSVNALVVGLMWLMSSFAYCVSLIEHVRMHNDYKAILKLLEAGTTQPQIITIEPERIARLEQGVAWLADKIRANHAETLLAIGAIQPIQSTTKQYIALDPLVGSMGHGAGYTLERQSIKLQGAIAWLKENDRGLKLTIREAERLSEYPRSTINRAQQWIRNE